MSLRTILKIRSSLSFQLSLWYAGLFALSSFVTLSIFYYAFHTTSMRELDESLMEEVQEMIVTMKNGGLEKVREYMVFEVETEEEDAFYRLFSGGVLLDAKSNHPTGYEADKPASFFKELTMPVFETLKMQGEENRVRTVYGPISSSEIIQVGKSMAEIDQYLYVFRSLLILSIFPLFMVSAFIGWFLARHALAGVEEVTRTAIDISGGSYEKRVRVYPRADEIARLANTFNAMLDRLQAVMGSMREMTDNIAHDLRSPLARIRGFAEMTLMKSSSVEAYETLAVNTIEECDNLISMINTMLDITEMEAGAGILNVEETDVAMLVSDACELFDPIARERDIRIVRKFDGSPLIFRTDRRKLQRLVTNLLENAIKYNNPGGAVTVTLKDGNGRIQLVFEDTGIGISEAEISRIFDRFYRCDRSRSNSGIGLGLSLAKAIANALGGDIKVSSRENGGSTFIVTLPV